MIPADNDATPFPIARGVTGASPRWLLRKCALDPVASDVFPLVDLRAEPVAQFVANLFLKFLMIRKPENRNRDQGPASGSVAWGHIRDCTDVVYETGTFSIKSDYWFTKW